MNKLFLCYATQSGYEEWDTNVKEFDNSEALITWWKENVFWNNKRSSVCGHPFVFEGTQRNDITELCIKA
jgi:hypothetical protein